MKSEPFSLLVTLSAATAMSARRPSGGRTAKKRRPVALFFFWSAALEVSDVMRDSIKVV